MDFMNGKKSFKVLINTSEDKFIIHVSLKNIQFKNEGHRKYMQLRV